MSPLPTPKLEGEFDDAELSDTAAELRSDTSAWAGLLAKSAAELLADSGLTLSPAEAARLGAKLLTAQASELDAISATLASKPRGGKTSAAMILEELSKLQSGPDAFTPEGKKRRAELRAKLTRMERTKP
jgi:hypothetical protein